eukprot:GHUV01000512.1.p1 GENE.GHUV01000512.1~~GHUV01000512.1.p1  ORF type:complete len:189 (+),score=54.40 GHUV01000512.1:193-759(+)
MQLLNRLQPIHKAALTSCSLMALGDVACQAISCKAARKPLHIDLARAGRFGIIGLTLHGPLFFKGFGWLDRQFGAAQTLKLAVTKSLAGQVTLFPTYTTLVLLYASLLEGQGLQHGLDKVKHKIPNLFATGSVYWPVVNVMNFLYVPPAQRILAVNACAIVWNTYLSYVNAAPLPAVNVAATTAAVAS